jgi:hypothetical protein
MATRRAKSGDAVVVDFSDTESRGGKKGGRSAHLPEGDYTAKVRSAEFGHSSEKETPGIMMAWVITSPKEYKGKTLRDSLWLSDKALWRVRQTLEALGLQVPSKKVKVNPKSMIGKEAAITVEDEEYDNKVRSRIVDCFNLSEYEELQSSDGEALDEDEDEDEDEEEEETETDDDEDEEEVEVDLDDLDSI